MTTNYERIKNMTVEEMAEEFSNIVYMVTVEHKITSTDEMERWLQAESEEG